MRRIDLLLRGVTFIVLIMFLLSSLVFAATHTSGEMPAVANQSPLATPAPLKPSPPAMPVTTMLSPIATPTTAIRSEIQAVLDGLRQEIIPAEGTDAGYGASFTAAGYNTLLAWNSDVPLTDRQRQDFAGLHVRLPCCAFADILADEAQNCACGHHVALYGAAKKLLVAGWDRAAVQSELVRWERYFFPKEALLAELVRRSAFDPQMAQALEELKTKGGC